MRHGAILAGGSGTRLWPMSRKRLPKQLLPFVEGKSLLEVSFERVEGLVGPENVAVCASAEQREAIARALPRLRPDNFLGEPVGRDTLSAVGLAAAVIAERDPAATIGTFTADHLIRPLDRFRSAIAAGYELAEEVPGALVTFGVVPAGPSTAYGYLELGAEFDRRARRVARFHEKPGAVAAARYFEAGPGRYLWNSGMFVWKAGAILERIRRYEPDAFAGLAKIARAWMGPDRERVLAATYPSLRKTSVDYAVMEPASRDPEAIVLAVPLEVEWLDVGSWTSFAASCPKDASENALGACRHALEGTRRTLVASSDPEHLIAAIGCEDLLIVHTPDATLVCRREDAEKVKEIYQMVSERFGGRYS